MNIDKIMKYRMLLEDEQLSEKERMLIECKMYREMNKGDSSMWFLLGLVCLSPALLLFMI
ncbi:hypothetical protein CVD28_00310 [Bacillus sp. M6-12]|uniref:hypothetical protein n=1 Tax=Bacillus sp. M6-12 TaxID=2054166 RepID=UPI000C77B292|nr:hypothetical protein [Bacillus sp. M6-12]PLS18878.1 hypothetical protein CVD28_00310 [Bacillus sp. M6-12]